MSKRTSGWGLVKLGLLVALGFAAAVPGATVITERSANAADKPEITGSYKLAGAGADGLKYTGTAVISKIGGDMYNGKWTIGETTFSGICFRDDDDLSCGWSDKVKDAHDLGVVAYLVKDDGLDGVWFEAGGTKLGNEFLSPKKTNAATLAGTYTITKGKNPDGSAYSGSCTVKQMTAVSKDAYDFAWNIGGTPIHGVGIRNSDAGQDDVISVGFSDAGGSFGALQYNVVKGGKVLAGSWVQLIGAKLSNGTETATKQ